MRINWILPRANLGGGTRTVRELAEQLEARGHTCTIAHLGSTVAWPPPWRARSFARRLGLAWQVRGKEQHHLAETSVATIEVQADRIEAGDVPEADFSIATWWETMEWIQDWPASRGRHAYYVQHHEIHGGEPDRVRATYRAPGLKIVIARWLEDLMRSEYGAQSTVRVPNGLDLERFDAPARPRGRPPTVGLMYSTKAWKRTDLAFEAISRARERVPELRVLAFGEMPLRSEPPPPPGLEFLLRPDQSRIPSLYARCDVWVLASDLEGFGMPGLEAAACRCPVVATRCGGAEEYVQHGTTGLLVPVGDVQALADAIVEIVHLDPLEWTRMSEAGHRAARSFRWETSAEILEKALIRYQQA